MVKIINRPEIDGDEVCALCFAIFSPGERVQADTFFVRYNGGQLPVISAIDVRTRFPEGRCVNPYPAARHLQAS